MTVKRRLQFAILGLAGLGAVLGVLGCGSSGGAGNSKSNGSSAKIRMYADINSMDPALTNSGPAYQLSMFLYDRLVTVQDSKIVPELATKWQESPTEIEFTIRPGVSCADGTKLTPSVVKSSMERLADPATKSVLGREYLGEGTKFTADDASSTFTVTLKEPNSDLLENFAEPPLSVICPAGLKAGANLQTEAFGTGPYTLASAEHGVGYTLKRRSGYAWGPNGESNADAPVTLELKVVENETTAANLFLNGELDILPAGEESSAARLLGKGYFETKFADGINFLLFNQGQGRLGADEALRRAIASAVDPKTFAAAAHGSLGVASTGNLFPPQTTCSDTDGAKLRPAYDPSGARKALEEAGWSPGQGGTLEKDGKPLSLSLLGNSAVGKAPEYVAQTLEDLGIDVQVKVVSLEEYVERASGNSWDLVVGSLVATPTPSEIALVFGQGLDWGEIRNPEYNSSVAAAKRSSTSGACPHWRDAQNALIGSASVVPEAFSYLVDFGNELEFSVGSSGLIDPTSIKKR